MKYSNPGEGNNACVKSALKSIFLRRGLIFPSNDEFIKHFVINPEGIDLDKESLNNFLQRFNLSSEHIRPNSSIIEPDMVLEEALKQEQDIMAAFYFNSLIGCNGPIRHVALVEDFQYPSLILHDYLKPVSLEKMIKAMSQDTRCGFYLIS